MNSDSPDQARYRAHVQADREYKAANPDYNPWHPTTNQTTSHDAYVQTRVAEILNAKEQQCPASTPGSTSSTPPPTKTAPPPPPAP